MKNRGFTLIELLVVIAVIAMISSFALALLDDSKTRTRDSVREEHIKDIRNGIILYATNNQYFPFCDPAEVINGVDDCLSAALIGNGSMSSLPTDPLGGSAGDGSGCPPSSGNLVYCYKTSADGLSYVIHYFLETDTISGKSAGLQIVNVQH